ncbi:glutamate 5-kinase [Povalibacter uvarum]|uniref:Glutamate 5-kinase n=1 Tax=Povalibacter uvarum TaxID=732238 RepID=A0A841HKJ4_9GAMM|nr:glutamate 5-kinase [Povalibacter uvarum]MBB6093567.1 glutamate 5-kinase [Povalibacter uvarum]
MTKRENRASADPLRQARRVVIKVGSALLVDAATGQLNREWLETLAQDIAALRARGQDVLLVSSGAIALGRRHLKLEAGKLRLEESQAAAAVGQIRLAHAWKDVLERHDLTVAQILLTFGDTEERRRYLNARSTLGTLLKLGAIPVINENDTVATAEIRYGDNDRLAARVAQMMSADCLVLLSDVDGLYTADPTKDPSAQFIPEVPRITPEIERMAGGAASSVGSGGMATKIAAAKIAVTAGCHMCVAAGREMHPLRRIEEGARCSWFYPAASPATVRKQWIAGTLKAAGEIYVDDGAASALRHGKSLLPAGVTRVAGKFERGDALVVRDREGLEIARGLSAYSSDDAERLAGRKSAEIEALLGFRGRDELIHRDDLVITVGA